MQGYQDLAKILIKYGADINHKGKDGSTALHLAAQEGRIETVDVLLKAGANSQTLNHRGRKPESTNPEITSLLNQKFEQISK
jgi:ankyrin repeat protein